MKIPSRNDVRFWIFLLLLITTGIGFFLPVSSGNWLGFLGKGFLFLFIFFILYPFFFDVEWPSFPIRRAEKVDDEIIEETATIEMPDADEWRGFGIAFQQIAQEFLSIIRSAVVASSSGLYLQKGKDGLEFQVGDSDHGQWNRRFVVGEGTLIDHVAKQKIPVLEDNLPIGTGMDGIPGVEIRSFIGIPLLYEEEVIGVLAFGGETTESFGKEDEDFLVRCGGLISEIMSVCHRGLRWEMDQEVYKVHLELEKMMEQVTEEENAVALFAQNLRKLFYFDRLTVCVRDGEEGIIRYVFGQLDGFDRGIRFPLSDGLNGWILKRNAPMIIQDMEKGDYIRPRYFRNEESKHGLRAFLGVPLGRGEEPWGCITLESRTVNQYTEKGKEVLQTLSSYCYSVLERIHLMTKFRNLAQSGPDASQSQFRIE